MQMNFLPYLKNLTNIVYVFIYLIAVCSWLFQRRLICIDSGPKKYLDT